MQLILWLYHSCRLLLKGRSKMKGIPQHSYQSNLSRTLLICQKVQPPTVRSSPLVDKGITTLFVRRCVYFAYFGKPSPHGSNELHSEPSADDGVPDVLTSPLFVPEDTPMEEARPGEERVSREQECREGARRVEARHRRKEQKRERRERRHQQRAEQERLQREAEERAVAERAEEERLQRETEERAAAEQARLERAEQEQVEHMERLRKEQELFEAEDYPGEQVAQAAQDRHPEQGISAQTENTSKQVTQLDLRGLLRQQHKKDEPASEPNPEASPQSASGLEKIRIIFKILERENWRKADTLK
ncbi:hypothetical protein ACJ72_01555 [Emergomyces africanus]|uniref:Uncharacterized protein n=1 Tax=Emergomyces africanus TaxID=1955775 RepID=A0A1B7P4X0_9EURO|nr:hypothetical protein ACJ72_01555 [Emergomyces africanus]